MKKAILLLLAFSFSPGIFGEEKQDGNKLVVLWISDDQEYAENMVFMYTYNAKRKDRFDEVVLIIWGPSAKLTAENQKIQKYLKMMKDEGVKLAACLYCAKMYGVEEELRALGIDVKGMGDQQSDYLKEDWKVLSL